MSDYRTRRARLDRWAAEAVPDAASVDAMNLLWRLSDELFLAGGSLEAIGWLDRAADHLGESLCA